ncbi:hypothetical protein M422DRAFT_170065 [Sphaerobolus stellatus SS14]|uniref:Enoyl reductase (ER) domain-containing protein n=1 Tax=Sphaerobolus stellatus (strain SS14) TaxID=990650 RepID=A0A0C9UJD9_SPHS4|nr:hypothetical protein M422DRAFT_170065 [Sphaerobolus stellatus SS14]
MSSSTLPKCMRAWTFSSQGLPRDILSLDHSYPAPSPPAKSNLLIRVSCVGLNPGCYITMATIPPLVRRLLRGPTSPIAEGEFSGVIHLAGPAAPKEFAPGTPVFGCLPMMRLIAGEGTLAEYIVIPSSLVAVVPQSMSMVQAAGLSGAGQTALNMFSAVLVKEGDRILVNGGSGGVGTMVVQLAKAQGAYVVATCSGANAELVKGLGADQIVDYRTNKPLHKYLGLEYEKQPFDAIFDTIGTQDLFIYSPQYLKPNGTVVNVGNFEGPSMTVFRSFINTWLPVFLGGIPRNYLMISTTPNGNKAARLGQLVEEGKLRVVVDEIVEFEDVLRVSIASNKLEKWD